MQYISMVSTHQIYIMQTLCHVNLESHGHLCDVKQENTYKYATYNVTKI